jgi:tRNA dimethylallyltransferase
MNTEENILIIVMGPTASGKTALSIDIAQHFGAEIISCDARQFYREMEIGTAKPDAEELVAVPHHFINSHSIHEDYSAGDFERDAIAFLEDYYQNHQIAVMVGGSGLYVRLVCEGADEFPEVPEGTRESLQALFEEEGIEALQKELQVKDPDYFEQVDQANPVRLIRALEVCRASGKPYSSFLNQPKKVRNFRPIKVAWDWDRQKLYDRINLRVDLMLKAGLEEEARSLYPYRHLNALQTVGYQEWNAYFEGQISRDEAIELIKRNSRRYAKRQLTWCRKEKELDWFKAGTKSSKIIQFLEEKINSKT